MGEYQRDLIHRAAKCIHSDNLRTSVVVVGAGGTGSHVVHGLANMHNALIQIGHRGLIVNLYDDDTVAPHNVGRQRFAWADVKENKATALIKRINRMHGLDWSASTTRFDPKHDDKLGNILITAVDDGKTRNRLHKAFRSGLGKNNLRSIQQQHQSMVATHYWLDLGNDDRYGQVALAASDLPTCVELFGQYKEEKPVGSCSALESLRSQDLFINAAVANAGLALLWDLFARGGLTRNVVYVNLKDHTTRSAHKTLESCSTSSSVKSTKSSVRKAGARNRNPVSTR